MNHHLEPSIELDALAHSVVDAAFEVHRWLGPGFLEAAYEEALCHELAIRGLPFERQVPIEVHYKDARVAMYRLDLVVGGQLVIELKASEALAPLHVAQMLSYLKAAKLSLGLVITFNVTALRTGIRRVILSR